MPDEHDSNGLSRRKILGGLGTVGAAGALGGIGTTSLLWDEEKFGNVSNPNILQGGKLDLQVGWRVRYYDWIETTPRILKESDLTNQPGPIVELSDLKPGDVIELSLDAHVFGNPAFLSGRCDIFTDEDNGYPEPEDKVDGHEPNNFDGTQGGDLADALQVVVWFDDGDGLPQEIWDGSFPSTEEYVMALGDADRPSDIFDLESSNFVGGGGPFSVFCTGSHLFDPRVNGNQAEDFPDSLCYQNSETESIGLLMWLPRDIPGINDNIIQTDRIEFQFGFDAIQCRHNVGNDGRPIEGFIGEADTEHNSLQELRRITSDIRTLSTDTETLSINGIPGEYHLEPHCISNPPGPGAMGFHYVNPVLLDDEVDPNQPEALVYQKSDGVYELGAVEYIVPTDLWGEPDPPNIFNRDMIFTPPLDAYALHAWMWRENPAGTFAPFNPDVSCPD